MKYISIILILFFLGNAFSLNGQIEINKMKAAYTEKFTRFIEWPEKENKSHFIIGYFHKTDYIEALQQYLQEITIKDMPVEFLELESYALIPECDLICLDEQEEEEKEVILDYIKESPVLTVGHYPSCTKEGFHINFLVKDQKLKFEINPDSFKKSQLKVSYHLLQLAKIVDGKA